MASPLVSIIICCHNRAHLLSYTLNSALSQNYRPVEILVLDDGSIDNTPELVASYGDSVKYIRQENSGISIARTNACKHACGEYIAFLDDDDLMPPDRITILHNLLIKFPSAIFSVGDIAYIDSDGKLTNQRWLPDSKLSNKDPHLIEDGFEAVTWPHIPASLHSSLFRRTDGEMIGWFNPDFKYASEDKDFLARLGQLGPVAYVPKIVSYYRRGHPSLTFENSCALYSKLNLLINQLNFAKSYNDRLKKRLQSRILLTLKKIAYNKRKGMFLPDTIPNSYISDSLAFLGIQERISYIWYVFVILNLKRILKKQ